MRQAQSIGTAVLPAWAAPMQGKGESRPKAVAQPLPLTAEAIKLLRGAQAQLSLAGRAGESVDRFEHAHLAALRFAGAVNDAATRGVKTRRQENVWQKLARVAPGLAVWAVVFEESARIRVRVEAGDVRDLDGGRADFWIGQVQFFARDVNEAFGMSADSPLMGRVVAA